MAITAEWIINKSKAKIYAISHAKAVIRGTSTVDADLSTLENNITAFEASVAALQKEIDNLDLTAIQTHLTAQLNSEEGAHGLRYYNDVLQFNNGTEWVDVETGITGVPPANMKWVKAVYGQTGTKVVLKGSDPEDIELDNGTLCVWAGTKIVRKTGSYPTKPTDGVLVVDYQTRNQYQTTGFVDSGLVEGETYYYRWFPYADTGAINMSPTGQEAKITTRAYTVVGVRADWANSTYTRLDSAVGLTGGSKFDQFEMYGGRRRCIVEDNGVIVAFYGEDGYTETGKLTKSVVAKNGATYPSGTSVQVMVYQPKFYYKMSPVTQASNPQGTGYMIRCADYWVSDNEYDGFKVHPAFVRNGVELPYILVSAFECCTQNTSNAYITTNASLGNRLASIAGAKPATGSDGSNTHSFTRSVARTLATARGSHWQMGDVLTASMTQLLFMIEYATMNSQTAIGLGNVNSTGSYAGVIVTGGTSSLGSTSGRDTSKTDGVGCVSYRGEENLWGNVWTWQDGLNCYNSNTGIAYLADHGFKDDSTASPYTSTGFNFARSNAYISAFGYSSVCDFLFLPCEVSGDSSNPVGDYFYQAYSSTSMTVAWLGGCCADGLGAGLFCWAVANASSSSGWTVGSRLVCLPDEDADAA